MASVPKYSNPFEFDMLMLEPVHRMMMKGIRIDQNEKARLQQAAIDEWKLNQERLNRLHGRPLNVESKKEIPHLLYNTLGLTKKTRGGKLRADKSALRALMAECEFKMNTLKTDEARRRWTEGYLYCRLILNIRGIRKSISSYLGLHVKDGELAGDAPFEDSDGRIRSTISVGGAENARFTHSKTLWDTGVNIATIPRNLRSMFIPDDGYELAEFDLNRGESWVYAHLSQDPELLRIHTEGLDFHAETASAISIAFGDPLSVDYIVKNREGDAYKIRYLGKKVNHASSYRMKSFKGAEVVNEEADSTGITCTVAEFKKAQRLWMQKYFMIESWWSEVERELAETKTLVTPYGRVHQFHDAWGDSLFKAATSYVPSSTSVDYINRGFLRVYHKFVKPGAWGLSVLAQTHDSILTMYRTEDRDEAIPEIANALRSSLVIKKREFSIPIEPNYGDSWGHLNEWSE